MSDLDVHFVVLSDSHVCRSPTDVVKRRRPAADLQAVVQHIARLPVQPDFLFHAGDVCGGGESTSLGEPEAYRLAESILSQVPLPRYYAAGNHDDPQAMRQGLSFAQGIEWLGTGSEIHYRFAMQRNGRTQALGFVLDGRIGTEPNGVVPAAQLDHLAVELATGELPLFVFLHFPPTPLGTHWADEKLLLENGEELHRILLTHHRRISAVVFGHTHRSIHLVREGINYIGCASTTFGFDLGHAQSPFSFLHDSPPAFLCVSLTPKGLALRPYLTTDNSSPVPC